MLKYKTRLNYKMTVLKVSPKVKCDKLIPNNGNIGLCSGISDCNTQIADTSPRHICPIWAKRAIAELVEIRKEIKVLKEKKHNV